MDYRNEMLRTLNNNDGSFDETEYLINATLGLVGESGEVADILKKYMFQGHTLDKQKLVNELGDVRFYLELACYAIGVTLNDIEEANSKKLRKRYPNGFDAALSQNRDDTHG